MTKLAVAIEQNECTGCGKCPEWAPRHFFMADDGLAHVKEDSIDDPTTPEFFGKAGQVVVNPELYVEVGGAVEDCPVECIYITFADEPADVSL
jgi:ferredoxin